MCIKRETEQKLIRTLKACYSASMLCTGTISGYSTQSGEGRSEDAATHLTTTEWARSRCTSAQPHSTKHCSYVHVQHTCLDT